MSVLLKELRDRLESIRQADITPPEVKVGKGEEVVGRLDSEEVRRLFTLSGRLLTECRQAAEASLHHLVDTLVAHRRGEPHDPGTCAGCQAVADVFLLQQLQEAVNTLLWAAVRRELPRPALLKVMDLGTIGLREDWQIVAMKADPTPSVLPIILDLPFPFSL